MSLDSVLGCLHTYLTLPKLVPGLGRLHWFSTLMSLDSDLGCLHRSSTLPKLIPGLGCLHTFFPKLIPGLGCLHIFPTLPKLISGLGCLHRLSTLMSLDSVLGCLHRFSALPKLIPRLGCLHRLSTLMSLDSVLGCLHRFSTLPKLIPRLGCLHRLSTLMSLDSVLGCLHRFQTLTKLNSKIKSQEIRTRFRKKTKHTATVWCYCVPVRYVGTSDTSASARDGILSRRRAGAHRTYYGVAISKTIVNSRCGRLPCLCRPSIASQSVLIVPVWDLHNAGSLESWDDRLALCRSHMDTCKF